ncbi:MAG: hypothetical protein HY921_04950 [Elusimicrobia bacterium]|nr:hypothetical protein [Elusimicrobiota bacterium]
MKKTLCMLFLALNARAAGGLPAAAPTPGGLPEEVVVKGEAGTQKFGEKKPPVRVEVDPYESIRPSLEPNPSLLLTVSPLTVSWRRTYPDFLLQERVVELWRSTFSQRPGIAFPMRQKLEEVLQAKLTPRQARQYAWSLSIVDQEGRVFEHHEGSSLGEELVWRGLNSQDESMRAGQSYSAVYTFTDPRGSPRTSVGKQLLFNGMVHQEDSGLHISLDSATLFGSGKSQQVVGPVAGADLLRSASDLIKRRYYGIPLAIRAFAQTKELGLAQAKSISAYLAKDLMLASRNISVDAAPVPYSDQRVEIVLLNR